MHAAGSKPAAPNASTNAAGSRDAAAADDRRLPLRRSLILDDLKIGVTQRLCLGEGSLRLLNIQERSNPDPIDGSSVHGCGHHMRAETVERGCCLTGARLRAIGAGLDVKRARSGVRRGRQLRLIQSCG